MRQKREKGRRIRGGEENARRSTAASWQEGVAEEEKGEARERGSAIKRGEYKEPARTTVGKGSDGTLPHAHAGGWK